MTRNLVQTCNLRASCTYDEIMLFDDDASGAFQNVKLHPQAVVTYAYSIGQILYAPISSVFGTKVIPHKWEVFT